MIHGTPNKWTSSFQRLIYATFSLTSIFFFGCGSSKVHQSLSTALVLCTPKIGRFHMVSTRIPGNTADPQGCHTIRGVVSTEAFFLMPAQD
uniref:Uncharacterized protein n=1 Tax=Setaria italica TaxID=4555 RepID=K3YX56_SETIT